MTGPELIERAIREGCAAADIHLRCSYPKCACRHLPEGIRAAIAALLAAVREPEMIEKLAMEVQCYRRTADDARYVLDALARELGVGE